MKIVVQLVPVLLAFDLAACGSSDEKNKTPDAATKADAAAQVDAARPMPDAPPGEALQQVDCAQVTAQHMLQWTTDGQQPPQRNVKVGEVVRVAGAGHAYWETSGAWTSGEETCLRFLAPATYGTYCYLHSEEPHGGITVTP